MVTVVKTKASNNPDLLTRKRRKKMLHSENILRKLRRGVSNCSDYLVRFDSFALVGSKANCMKFLVNRRGLGDSEEVCTIKFRVYWFTDMDLTGLCGHKADESGPLL